MALSGKRPGAFWGIVILIFIVAIGFIYIKSKNSSPKKETASSSVYLQQTVHQADSALGYSLVIAEQNANTALVEAEAEKQPRHLISSSIILGRIQYMLGNYSKSLDFYKQAQSLAIQNNLLKEQCE